MRLPCARPARGDRAPARRPSRRPPPTAPPPSSRRARRGRPAWDDSRRRRSATGGRSCGPARGRCAARPSRLASSSESVVGGSRSRKAKTPGPSTIEVLVRTIWNGSLSFGLVNIPVGLALATSPKARASDVSFRQLHRDCKTPIRQKRWCPVHDREVGPDEIVKGWEVSKGEFVVIQDADLEAIQLADDSRAIEITRFVPLDEVDPVYFDRTYYLSPANTLEARRPYVLLLEALKDTGMAAVGRFVLRGNETFCLIRPRGEALALETLFLAEDVRSQAEIEEAVSETQVRDAELELARQVIDSLVADFEPQELESVYRGNLRSLLEAKLAGQEITKPEPVEEDAPVIDLMDALRASVAQASKKSAPAKKPARTRKTAAAATSRKR